MLGLKSGYWQKELDPAASGEDGLFILEGSLAIHRS
jgi:hypothetical protein